MARLSSTLTNLPTLGLPISGNRRVEYLRLSVTDRCNERCIYCLPEQYQQWAPREDVLSDSEFLSVVCVAAERGFKHFRITGGEPLLRPNLVKLIAQIRAIAGVDSLQMTTNGTLLHRMAHDLKAAGLDRLNISLDALDPKVYTAITRSQLQPVLKGIETARGAGFESIKLNTVLMRGKNSQEILPLIKFAAERGLVIRFIELMPVSLTEMLSEANFLPVAEVKAMITKEDSLEPISDELGLGPAKYFRLPKIGATVGFIGALTDLHFCESCNKVRVTADGKIRPCLGHHGEVDMKGALRPFVDTAKLHSLFDQALAEKPPQHIFRDNYKPGRVMTAIGG